MIFDILMSVGVICLIAVFAIRLIAVSGSGNRWKLLNYFSKDNSLGGGYKATWKKLLYVFVCALIFRLVAFLCGALIIYMLNGEKELSLSTVISKYYRWDAYHYLTIAEKGYAGRIEDGQYILLVFFPLFPMLVRLFSVFIQNQTAAGLAVSWLSYAGACTVLTALLSIDYDEETADNSIIYLSVFPFAYFFGACMTESTFLLTVALSMYFIRRHRWFLAGVFGFLASLSRVTGVMLVFAYFAEWMQSGGVIGMLRGGEYKRFLKYVFKNGLPVLIIPLGMVVYLLMNYAVAGDAFAFLEYEKSVWHQEMKFFGKTFALIRSYAVMTERMPEMFTIWLPQIAAIILCLAASFYGITKHRAMYYGFLVPYFLTNISAAWPISGCRYMSCAFPLFIFLADFSSRHKRARAWILVSFSILFGIYFAAWFKNLIC